LLARRGGGLSRRRQATGLVVAATGLPLLTGILAALRPHLALVDDVLFYLAGVVAVTLIGGFWPALVAAVASSLVLNWFFTPPVHTWTIESPQNVLALVLFVGVAVTVSSVVHLAARRAFVADELAHHAAQAHALAEGNRLRTALLTAVSHDLRTPLASVKAAVSTLRQTDVSWSPSDQAELLATIEDGADRLNALIGNLLDMSRIQTGALQPLIRPTALDEVAPLVVQGLEDASAVRLDIPDDLPLVAADPGLLERVLANLVSNALRYSPADRPPTLTASIGDRTVSIDVVDHGPGVPADQWATMVQPFQQLGDRRSSGGVGLGLAVAKGFVEAMSGTLTATATAGGGLTMRVELPTPTVSGADTDALQMQP
jgi:two-component system, OmpR family, sensor histidine kinase KdpD